MTIIEAKRTIFARWFRGVSWKPWETFLRAVFGLFLDEAAFEIFKRQTGRTVRPVGPFTETHSICGRRAGKSLIGALIVTFCSVFLDYSAVSVPGETLAAMLLGADKKQAGILLKYINSFFSEIPVLAQMVISRTSETISLSNGVTIIVGTSDYRAVRGYTIVCAVADELAFWPSGDAEVLDALRPAMATIPGAILLGMSSPYAKRGVLWENFRDHYGKDDSPVLVWRARTRAMNPTVSRAVIAAAYLRDAASAKAEYGAQFRSEIESFIPIEALEACVVPGRFELGPIPGVNYFGFTDPSGGSSDSFTLGIAHADGETVALDLLRETQPPFSPEAVIADFGTTLKKYRLSEVTGDRYAGEFPRELFSKCGVTYRVAEKTRSELYLELLPCLMSGRVQLLDNKRLVAQLSGLERRTARSGKDSIDHGPGQHDDCSNAVAGAAVLAMAAHGGVLGVLEYEQLEAAGKLGTLQTQASNKEFLYQFEAKVRGLQPTAPALQWKEEPLPACPACKTTIVAQLSAKEFRCAECATQWFKVSHEPNPVRGQRGEWLAGGPNAKSFRIRKQEFFWMDLTK